MRNSRLRTEEGKSGKPSVIGNPHLEGLVMSKPVEAGSLLKVLQSRRVSRKDLSKKKRKEEGGKKKELTSRGDVPKEIGAILDLQYSPKWGKGGRDSKVEGKGNSSGEKVECSWSSDSRNE